MNSVGFRVYCPERPSCFEWTLGVLSEQLWSASDNLGGLVTARILGIVWSSRSSSPLNIALPTVWLCSHSLDPARARRTEMVKSRNAKGWVLRISGEHLITRSSWSWLPWLSRSEVPSPPALYPVSLLPQWLGASRGSGNTLSLEDHSLNSL